VAPGLLVPTARYTHRRPGTVYIWVNDLSALHKELQSKGAKVIRGPEEAFYHTREIVIEDGSGYVLCFGQNIEN
jgi:predicted enzyme related to lactoylglutathione lyase